MNNLETTENKTEGDTNNMENDENTCERTSMIQDYLEKNQGKDIIITKGQNDIILYNLVFFNYEIIVDKEYISFIGDNDECLTILFSEFVDADFTKEENEMGLTFIINTKDGVEYRISML